MPYWSYKSWIVRKYGRKKGFSVLEIGVDKGQMIIPLVGRLIEDESDFLIVGIDVRKDDDFLLKMEESIPLMRNDQEVRYHIVNSLQWLPECHDQFDVVLIDGDHNYFTVSHELSHVDRIVKQHGVVIVDDYTSKWGKRDLFYSTRETHADLENTTKVQETERHGVKAAVDDFLESHGAWKKVVLYECEAILLTRSENDIQK